MIYLHTFSLYSLWLGVLIGDYEVGKVSSLVTPIQPLLLYFAI